MNLNYSIFHYFNNKELFWIHLCGFQFSIRNLSKSKFIPIPSEENRILYIYTSKYLILLYKNKK